MTRLPIQLIVVFLFVISLNGNAQTRSLYQGVSVKGSTGISMVHGDLTINPFGKISDGKFGFGVTGTKMFSPFFGIQFGYSSSNLSTIRADLGEQYTGQISQIGLSTRIVPLKPIGPNGLRRLYPYFSLGVSNASFRAIRWNTTTQQIIPPSFGYKLEDLSNGPRENALSFPIGVGFGVRLNDNLSLEIEHTNSVLNTDFLDATATGNWNDHYGFTNIGIRYTIDPLYQSGIPRAKKPKVETERKPVRQEPEIISEAEETGSIDPVKSVIPYSKVYVESIIPEHPISGGLIEILLRIHKGNYIGPATIIHDLPDGFTAVEVPLRHANLKFENNQTKINWSQMPVDSIITVRYHAFIDEQVSGPRTIRGSIWYDQPDGKKGYQFINQCLVTNRKELEMDDQYLNILAKQKTTPTPYSTSVVTQPVNAQMAIAKEALASNPKTMQIDELIRNYENTGTIATRSMNDATNQGLNRFDRSLVNESDLDKRIQNIIGPVSNATQRENLNPSKPATTEDDLDRQIERLIGSGSSATGGSAFVAKPGVEFRIQCGAFRSREESRALIKKHNIKEPLQEEYNSGLYKYTVGSFKTYQEAQAYRDAFIRRTNLLSVFIVGYKNGVRQANLQSLR